MNFNDLSTEARNKWRQRVERLGLNPDSKRIPFVKFVTAKSLAELTKFFGAPVLANQAVSIMKSNSIMDSDIETLKKSIHQHVQGTALITNSNHIDEINDIYDSYQVLAYVAEDKVITKDDPLIIDKGPASVVYGLVTIKDGGYIKITVPCSFQCSQLVSEQSSGTNFDFIVTGVDGSNGAAGDKGTDGTAGAKGNNAKCDCNVATNHSGDDGQVGGAGVLGKQGTDGLHGGDVPSVVIKIDNLASKMSIFTRGGNGGAGGAGGDGGQGGRGGDGGSDASCAAYYEHGGNGGNGGNGADGNFGGNGGNGGAGGRVVIYTNNPKNISTVCDVSLAGKGGQGGHVGKGGDGGIQGGGATNGTPGTPGAKIGANGHDGNQGPKGTVDINPPTVK